MKLTINERQAQVIAEALDIYSRIFTGDLRIIGEVLQRNGVVEHVSNTLRNYFDGASHILFGFRQPGAFMSILNKNVKGCARVAYDVLQVLEEGVARLTPEDKRTLRDENILKRGVTLWTDLPPAKVEDDYTANEEALDDIIVRAKSALDGAREAAKGDISFAPEGLSIAEMGLEEIVDIIEELRKGKDNV